MPDMGMVNTLFGLLLFLCGIQKSMSCGEATPQSRGTLKIVFTQVRAVPREFREKFTMFSLMMGNYD
jgi:hypothetical protein